MERYYTLNSSYIQQEALMDIVWRYGNEEVYDFYDATGYTHSFYTDDTDNVMYGTWYERSYGNEEYDCYYFSDEYGTISDREITFALSYSQSAIYNPITVYTYRFDENGNITEIVTRGMGNNLFSHRYVVTDTEESEIETWVEKVKSEF